MRFFLGIFSCLVEILFYCETSLELYVGHEIIKLCKMISKINIDQLISRERCVVVAFELATQRVWVRFPARTWWNFTVRGSEAGGPPGMAISRARHYKTVLKM